MQQQVQQRSRVGRHASRQGKPAGAQGIALRARAGVRTLAAAHRELVVAIKLGESVGRAGCKGLSGEGAGPTEVDEGRCASGPGSVAGCVTAWGVRCRCDSSGRLVQKSNPSGGVETIATSVELFGRDAGFARRAKEQHARRERQGRAACRLPLPRWLAGPRPRRPRPPPPRAVEARTRVAAAARRVSSSPTGSSSVGASSGASASRSRCAVLA